MKCTKKKLNGRKHTLIKARVHFIFACECENDFAPRHLSYILPSWSSKRKRINLSARVQTWEPILCLLLQQLSGQKEPLFKKKKIVDRIKDAC